MPASSTCALSSIAVDLNIGTFGVDQQYYSQDVTSYVMLTRNKSVNT